MTETEMDAKLTYEQCQKLVELGNEVIERYRNYTNHASACAGRDLAHAVQRAIYEARYVNSAN
jgi:hypothetical protein